MPFKEINTKSIQEQVKCFEEDIEKRKRIKSQVCKSCYYLDSKAAYQALTSNFCEQCNQGMIFPTSYTDKYCESCAKDLNACSHCGNRMD